MENSNVLKLMWDKQVTFIINICFILGLLKFECEYKKQSQQNSSGELSLSILAYWLLPWRPQYVNKCFENGRLQA